MLGAVCYEQPEAAVNVWGFFAVIVACAVGAWLYLRKRVEVVSVDESRRVAMEQARVDAADAFVQRQRTAAQIAAEGEAKAQAERVVVTTGAVEGAGRLAVDLHAQADAVADMVGASPSHRDTDPGMIPPPGPPK